MASADESVLLAHLAKHGESTLEDIELELGWDPRRVKQVRDRLQRVGAVVSEAPVFEDVSNWYLAPLRRWDEVFDKRPAVEHPYDAVVVAGMRAALLAPEDDLRHWFSWPIPPGTADRLRTLDGPVTHNGFRVRMPSDYGRPVTSTQDQNVHWRAGFCPRASTVVRRHCCQIAVSGGQHLGQASAAS